MVPSLEKRRDGSLQVDYAEEDAAADGLVVQVAEPSLDKKVPGPNLSHYLVDPAVTEWSRGGACSPHNGGADQW